MKKKWHRWFVSLVLVWVSSNLHAQKELEVVKNWIHYSDAPNALYHHIAADAYVRLDKRAQSMASISTYAAWQQRQQWIKKTLAKVVGPFPAKTPLQAKIMKTIQKDHYRVENIVYESQPGFYVTAALFIPHTLQPGKKAPAVIYCSGHSQTGYRSYQQVILNLVQKGFVVLAFDPIGQGERLQYYNEKTGRSDFKWPAWEHTYTGAQVFITGNCLARYMIWDGIRAVDYLLTRQEVDADRIGITGRSGGGTQSAYIAAFDERIKAVAPENYITNFKRLFQSIGAQDAEQDFPYGIEQGLDMADLLLARAPKPALMITTTQDMFPIQGAMETAQEVKRIYGLCGKPGNFNMVTDDAPHASTKKNREALYAFLQQALQQPGSAADSAIDPCTAEELQVTATGQVVTALKSETVFSLNQKETAQKIQALTAARKDIPAHADKVVNAAKRLSGYKEPSRTDQPLFTGRIQRPGYSIEKYMVQGEGDYVIPYLLFKPEKATGKAMLYLDPAGKLADAGAGGHIEWLVQQGITVLAPDIAGTGEMGPGSFRGDSYIDSVSFNIWFAAMLTGRSITGIQAGDVVRLVKLLRKDRNTQEIYALAKKQLSPVLLHAAAFCKDISRIALLQPYISYRSVVMQPRYDLHFLHSTVAGALTAYDLPDLAASLAPRRLLMAGVTDGNGQNKDTLMEADLSVIREVYRFLKKETALQLLPGDSMEQLKPQLLNWINQ